MSFFVGGPHDDGDAVTGHYYEMATGPDRAQVWFYTAGLSFTAGDEIVLHGISSAPRARIIVVRDGLVPLQKLQAEVAMTWAETPLDCSVKGCDWPEVWRFVVPRDWTSGVYVVTFVIDGHSSQHMFVVRAAQPLHRLVMVLATGTWCAYNDWGGSNHYQGLVGDRRTDAAHDVSLLRPWAQGFVAWPDGAPGIPHASPLLTRPRYPHMEFARARGVSKKYASSGWAAFERPFALWCAAQGIGLDYMTQHDLHRGGLAYDRAVIVGHDEYWSWDMRDRLDAWLDQGGQLARFAGNFYWQTRLSQDLLTQTCWKVGDDPVRGPRRTTYWDAPEVGRPAVATMGLTGSMGVYAGWSRCAAHGSGGFAVYRPEHWSLRETGLGYGDVLGASAKVFGYEVDGVELGLKHGLPFAEDAALQGPLQIVAMSPATTLSHHVSSADRDLFIGHLDAEDTARVIYGAVNAETLGRASRGNGCMAEYRRGRGAVFNVGSCEWVNGLIQRETTVERVTRT
ncbi:MAG: hypothetical protein H7245_06905, partial [Candidatus Saccharibacteria bacterium]|nr:hypothetical protein [Pseudorhodobacter sp.]